MSAPQHNISPDLAGLATPLAQLRPLPGNPRKGDVAAVARSYERFGQRKPVVALPDGTVIAGNHQLAAARMLGWTHIAVVRSNDDAVTAKAFALADNRIGDLGGYDDELLAQLIAEVGAADADLLTAAGYDAQDVDAITDALEEQQEKERDASEQTWVSSFEVIVTCEDEGQQRVLLDRLLAEGYDAKGLFS